MNRSDCLFLTTLERKNEGRPPVWFMRQAGRYHSHYQRLKQSHTFMELCKVPALACETTMGPIEDFNFDAAILFSDLLFPLEAMGMGLDYVPGPKLEWHLKEISDLEKIKIIKDPKAFLSFQSESIVQIRKKLPPSKGLLGFVGGPFTLFSYAVEGTHQGGIPFAKKGLKNGLYVGFMEFLLPLLLENMILQAQAGVDTVAVLDTCAGDLTPTEYKDQVLPSLKILLESFQAKCPNTPVTYYSKMTGPDHWQHLQGLPISCLGVDWHHPISGVLQDWSGQWAIQGGFDPHLMLQPLDALEKKIRTYFESVLALPAAKRRGWVCGLGHGVIKETPEESVRLFLRLQKEMFG